MQNRTFGDNKPAGLCQAEQAVDWLCFEHQTEGAALL